MEKYIVYQCRDLKKAARRGSHSSSDTLAGGFPGWIRASFRHRSFIREIFFLVQAQPLQGQMEFHYMEPTALYRAIYIW
jgi:mevalonate pyrophosphate decarboxylase